VINDTTILLSLWDTFSREGYDRLRPLSYPETDVFLILFSVMDRWSFDNVKEKWSPEIKHHVPLSPVLLVGTKSDLRNNTDMLQRLAPTQTQPITYEEASKLATEIKAHKYIESSSKNNLNINVIFEEAAKLAIEKKEKYTITDRG